MDLCRGPHVPSTGKLKVFKLMKRGRRLLARRLEERDAPAHLRHGLGDEGGPGRVPAHARGGREARPPRLGTQLDLFHIQEEAPGLVFWHPRAGRSGRQVEQYMRRVYRDNGYQEVAGPQILDTSLWEKTGHWENYRENMFTTDRRSATTRSSR